MSDDDPLTELATLVADARAMLWDAQARGAWGEEVLRRPEPDHLVMASPEAEPADGPAAHQTRSSSWSGLAQAARDATVPSATVLQRVRDELGDCRRCGLCKERRQIVFGVGSPDADLVVVGEAPGYHEDMQGEPFVGPAGQMLDRMLVHVLGLTREEVYILNVVKCRPPKNRNPLPDEVAACRPVLEAQLAAIRPKVGLVLGSVAFRALFGTDAGITRSRGQWKTALGIPMLPTFHPAYLLRKPEDKRLTFADLKDLRKRYDALGAARRG